MKKFFIFLVCFMAGSWNYSASAKVWRVNNLPVANTDFTTLDAAMEAIAVGDTIMLEGSPDSYSLSAAISKKVTIIGPGYYLMDNPNTLENKSSATIQGNVSISSSAAGTVIEGVRFYSSSTSTRRLYIFANDVIIRRCYVYHIYFDDNTSTAVNIYNTTITQCYVEGYLRGGQDNDKAYNVLITNNIFTESGVSVSYLYNTTIENNTFYVSTGSTIYNINYIYGSSTVQNNIFRNANNVSGTIRNNVTGTYIGGDSPDGRYQLAEDANAMTAGTNGSQCGAFGGATPYVLSGLPDIPHIYNIDAPHAASAAGGLSVTIKVGTEN